MSFGCCEVHAADLRLQWKETTHKSQAMLNITKKAEPNAKSLESASHSGGLESRHSDELVHPSISFTSFGKCLTDAFASALAGASHEALRPFPFVSCAFHQEDTNGRMCTAARSRSPVCRRKHMAYKCQCCGQRIQPWAFHSIPVLAPAALPTASRRVALAEPCRSSAQGPLNPHWPAPSKSQWPQLRLS